MITMDQPRVLNSVLTETEGAVLAEFLEPGVEIKDLIPSNPNLDDAWTRLSICLRTFDYAQGVTTKLKPIIGRFLRVARENPEFYMRKGYPTYERFLTDYVIPGLGMSRSALYECRMIAENLPDLSPEEYFILGSTKAKDLARFTKSSDPSFPEYLQAAHDRTSMEFRKYCETQKLIEAGETVPVVIVIQGNEKVEKMWAEFITIPEVHSVVGSSSPARILEHMIMECYAWTTPEEQARNRRRPV